MQRLNSQCLWRCGGSLGYVLDSAEITFTISLTVGRLSLKCSWQCWDYLHNVLDGVEIVLVMFLTVQKLHWPWQCPWQCGDCPGNVPDSAEIVLRMYWKWQFGDCLYSAGIAAVTFTVWRIVLQWEGCSGSWKFTKLCKTPTSILWSNSWDWLIKISRQYPFKIFLFNPLRPQDPS